MGDFAFRVGPVNDVWASRSSARRASDSLRQAGHKAVVEESGSPHSKEYRVRVDHPTDKGLTSYYHEDDHKKTQGDMSKYEPTWIAK